MNLQGQKYSPPPSPTVTPPPREDKRGKGQNTIHPPPAGTPSKGRQKSEGQKYSTPSSEAVHPSPPKADCQRGELAQSSSAVANEICSCETSRFPKPSSTGKLPFSRPLSQTFSLLRVLPLLNKYRRGLKLPQGRQLSNVYLKIYIG